MNNLSVESRNQPSSRATWLTVGVVVVVVPVLCMLPLLHERASGTSGMMDSYFGYNDLEKLGEDVSLRRVVEYGERLLAALKDPLLRREEFEFVQVEPTGAVAWPVERNGISIRALFTQKKHPENFISVDISLGRGNMQGSVDYKVGSRISLLNEALGHRNSRMVGEYATKVKSVLLAVGKPKREP